MENERNLEVQDVPEVTVKDWLITLLIMLVPVVNIIMMFVWAFGGGVNPSKANFFKAQLIWLVITSVLSFILFATVGTFIASQLF